MKPLALTAGGGIELCSVRPRDAESLFAVVDANRAYLRKWLPWVDAQQSAADTRSFIAQSRKAERDGTGCVAMIRQAGEPCGTVGFNKIDAANRSCEIGYWIREDRQGRGIVTRSVGALVRHAFETLDLNRVDLQAAVGNARSRRIPERLGFREIGVLPDAERLYDRYVDGALYVLLRRDWEAAGGG
jgi:ribosomal-protein-serine acetyltransferase